MLRAANLPARLVEGLPLSESIQNQLLTWIESWNGRSWEIILPEKGEVISDSEAFLPLSVGAVPALRVYAGELTEIRWTLSRQVVSRWNLHGERIRHSGRFLDQWSLFQLPPEFQRIFRILLLVPRMSVILTLVIVCFTFLAPAGNKLGLRDSGPLLGEDALDRRPFF